MRRPGTQISLSGLLALVACVALNIWLFRLGWLWGLVGLNVTKHVAVAVLCAAIGVNAKHGPTAPRAPRAIPRPHAARVP